MAKCIFCGIETRLYYGGSPICVACDDKRSRKEPEQKPPGKEMSSELNEDEHPEDEYQIGGLSPRRPGHLGISPSVPLPALFNSTF